MASKWHKITNVTNDALAGSLTGKGGHVFRECDITLANNGTVVYTEPFDFPVMGDLSIIANSNGADIGTDFDGANAYLKVQGSVDNTTWVELDSVTLDAVPSTDSIEGKAKIHLYDYDAEGRLPYMRLALHSHGNASASIKIAVIPH
tara:strand:+ start:407 stop:847 length:441 start_codon:yes stop_codon:yes gene_type:complete